MLEHVDDRSRINVDNIADIAVIRARTVGQTLRLEQTAVHAAETDAAAARLFKQGDQILVDLAAQHHLHNVHGLTVGIAQTVDEFAFLADPGQHVIDLRTAAMHDNDLDADQIEQNEVVDDRVLQLVIDHRVAAVLDDNGLTIIFLDIRKSLNQNVGSQLRIHIVCFLFCDGSIHAFSFLFRICFYQIDAYSCNLLCVPCARETASAFTLLAPPPEQENRICIRAVCSAS